jgi:hypothetical protein
MLKIYRHTIAYYIEQNSQRTLVTELSGFALKEESEAVNFRRECSAYSDEAQSVYPYHIDLFDCWRGKEACYHNWPIKVVCKEWKCPDAKLIISITYKESTCSMRELLEMDADKVMAYFKQNNLTFPQNMV